LTKLKHTNQPLNPNQKLPHPKQPPNTNLPTLHHLNDAQKQPLTTQLQQPPHIPTLNNLNQNPQNLNNPITNLNDPLQDKTQTLNTIN
ncbi:GA module-containing protein, partial [Staphylococcus aureus]|uniref:GA module-containing protein n=1 Tax=Staphylococcus aureus TaxID=1280 RepID=UPI0011A8F6D3